MSSFFTPILDVSRTLKLSDSASCSLVLDLFSLFSEKLSVFICPSVNPVEGLLTNSCSKCPRCCRNTSTASMACSPCKSSVHISFSAPPKPTTSFGHFQFALCAILQKLQWKIIKYLSNISIQILCLWDCRKSPQPHFQANMIMSAIIFLWESLTKCQTITFITDSSDNELPWLSTDMIISTWQEV